MPTTANTSDVLVIGAGIIGSACAFRLAERGLKVTVLEASSRLGEGSSGRSGAGVRVQFSEEVNVRLSWESIQEYRTFEARYERSSGYRANGYLFLVPESDWAAHEEGVAVQRRVGVPLVVLEPASAQALVPFVQEGIYRCTFGPADGYIDPLAVLTTYLGEAKQRGATVVLDAPVRQIQRVGPVWRVTSKQGTFEAPLIVNAAGAWSGEVARLAGLVVPVQPVKRCVYRSTGGNSARSYPLTIDVERNFWLRGHDETVIFTISNPEQQPGWDEGMDWAWHEVVRERGRQRFPWLGTLPLDRANSFWGYYEMTPDGSPVLGEMPGAPGWLNACGFSGHGVQQAAAVGRIIAAEAVGDTLPLTIDTLRLERFATSAHPRERHLV